MARRRRGGQVRRDSLMAEAHVLRPLVQLPWQRLRHLYCSGEAVYHIFTASFSHISSKTTTKIPHRLLLFNSSFRSSYHRSSVHLRTQALRLRENSLESTPCEGDGDSSSSDTAADADGAVTKSRNAKKRDAKRAFRWGMELANFSPAQIKLILRVTSAEPKVYDALMLIKRLGRDVREGKRRQFNYIGKLLREVEPELMDDLIQATKDGDNDKLRNMCGSETEAIEDGDETSEETEEEESETCIAVATRWLVGLISKDVNVMNEIYSLNNVDFDRQELRKLVRKVHELQEHQVSSESGEKSQEENACVFYAKRSLTRFLQNLAKQLPVE